MTPNQFAAWVVPYCELMGRLAGRNPGQRYVQAVIDFVRERGVQRLVR